MHPEIFSWTNQYLYNNAFKSGNYNDSLCLFESYIVFNLFDSVFDGLNDINKKEVEFITNLYQEMIKKMSANMYSYNIFTPYSKQRNEFIEKCKYFKTLPYLDTLNPTPCFERDIVLYSSTNTNIKDFDISRTIAALTRAKRCLIIVGEFETKKVRKVYI